METSRHWLKVWLLKKIRFYVRHAVKRSVFQFQININRLDLTKFEPTKYVSVHKDKSYILLKQKLLLYHKYYRKFFLNHEIQRIYSNIIRLVFPKNIDLINRYKHALPTARPLLLKVLAQAADQLSEQLIINQLSCRFIAPSLISLEQLQAENSAQNHFEHYLKFNMKKMKKKSEKVGIQKSVKSINTFFEEIHASKFKKTTDVFIPSTSLDKIVLFDTTSSQIEPLSFNESFEQFQNWLYLINKTYINFNPQYDVSAEIKVLGVSEFSDKIIDIETQTLLKDFFHFLSRYPFIVASFFKYIMESSYFDFFDIHLYKLSLTVTLEEITFFSEDSEIEDLDLELFPEEELVEFEESESDVSESGVSESGASEAAMTSGLSIIKNPRFI